MRSKQVLAADGHETKADHRREGGNGTLRSPPEQVELDGAA